jgi:hypothetical protein
MTTITNIEWSDRNESTHVVDIITLSDGRIIRSWNGNSSYCVYDKAHGRLQVGAILTREEEDESYDGTPFTNFHFNTVWEIKINAIIAAAPKGCYHIKLWTAIEGHVVNLTTGSFPFDCAQAAHGTGELSNEDFERFVLSCDRVDYLVGC